MRGWEHVSPSELANLGRAKAAKMTPKPPKYRNKSCVVGHEKFDSIHEAECWIALGARQQAGEILELRRQSQFDLHCPTAGAADIFHTVCSYIADFVWTDRNGLMHVADAKGGKATQTQLFKLKAKWLNLEYGLTVEIL